MKLATRALSGAALAIALTVPLLATAVPATASSSHGVTNRGSCSQLGTFKLSAKHDDARIEIEYEVDTNVAGQRFHVRLTDNGNVIAERAATTSGRSGSFTINDRTSNRAGADTIRVHAVSGSNVCGGRVRL